MLSLSHSSRTALAVAIAAASATAWVGVAFATIPDKDIAVVDGIGPCIALATESDRLQCYAKLCTPDYKCAESLLVSATSAAGPDKGIEVLHDLMQSHEAYGIVSDGHELAHVVGRQAAKKFGLSGEVFMRCPRDFFYGCGHGFFEIALALADSQSGAAVNVCGTLPQGQRFVCYHGVGHGLMMSHGDRVDESLAVCNELPKEDLGDQGCWQGVFMENVNTYIRRESLAGAFDPKDLLAPCDKMDVKYNRECYLNQSAVLVMGSDNSIEKASKICLKAGPTGIGPCIEGLGQFATNPGWQEIVSGKTYNEKDFLPTAVSLCNRFPKDYIGACETSAAGNLINYDSTEKALEFCGMVEVANQDVCYKKLVMELNRPLITEEMRSKTCAELPASYAATCRHETATAPAVSSSAAAASVAAPEGESLFVRAWHGFTWIIFSPFRAVGGLFASSPAPEYSDTSRSPDHTPRVIIHYADSTFVPSTVTIPAGETVEFVNDGDDYLWPASDHHPTHELYPAFDSKRAVTQAKPWSLASQA